MEFPLLWAEGNQYEISEWDFGHFTYFQNVTFTTTCTDSYEIRNVGHMLCKYETSLAPALFPYYRIVGLSLSCSVIYNVMLPTACPLNG